MPFGIPWTDGIEEPGAVARFLAFHWAARGGLRPRTGRSRSRSPGAAIVGIQELTADDFAGSRSVSSGSWLTASAQGRGLGVEMRAAVLHLAFAGLGALEAQTSAWIDNPASQRVSLRLGYGRRASSCSHGAAGPRGTCATGSRARHGSRTAATGSSCTGSSPACRCSGLHELAANLYNHATMATPTTQPRSRRGCGRAERRHRGRLGLCRPRAHAADRGPPAARRCAPPRRAPRASTRCRPTSSRAATSPFSACPTARAARSARRSRAPARPSSTSAPTSGSIRTGPTG